MAKALYGYGAVADRGSRAGWMGDDIDILRSKLLEEKGEMLRKMGELSRSTEDAAEPSPNVDVVTGDRIASPPGVAQDVGSYTTDKAAVELVMPEPKLVKAGAAA